MTIVPKLVPLAIACVFFGAGCVNARPAEPSTNNSTPIVVTNENGIFNNGIFTFRYPTNTVNGSPWTVEVGDDGRSASLGNKAYGGNLSFGTLENPERLDLRTWLSRQAYGKHIKNLRDVTYAGEKGVSYIVVEFDGHVDSKYYSFAKGAHIVDVYNDFSGPEQIVKDALDSFRFIK